MAKTINSIDRTATVANVVDTIRNKIILQEYPAGQKLTELALSAEYKISRGSVRTALQVMENEGLIATLPNGRKLVVGITEKFVTDLYETRGMLECEAARLILAQERVDYTGLAEIVNLFNELESSPDEVIIASRSTHNERFHRILLEMSRNRPLLQCWNTLEPLITAFTNFNSQVLGAKTHKNFYINTHDKILEMLIAKDPAVIEYLSYHTKVAARNDTLQGLRRMGCL